jgi:hypothetical protein
MPELYEAWPSWELYVQESAIRKHVAQSSSSEARSMRQRVTQLEAMLRSFIEPTRRIFQKSLGNPF